MKPDSPAQTHPIAGSSPPVTEASDMVELTEAQVEVLRELCPSYTDEAAAWMRPLDVGGSNGSHHSRTLGQLVALGLAEDLQRSPLGSRGSKVYRATPAGIEARYALPGAKRRTRAEGDAHFAALIARKRAEKAAALGPQVSHEFREEIKDGRPESAIVDAPRAAITKSEGL